MPEDYKLKFQSPQWGDNSKGKKIYNWFPVKMFQSPQWGDNSKGLKNAVKWMYSPRFSPRNGEIILKNKKSVLISQVGVSVPAMGR